MPHFKKDFRNVPHINQMRDVEVTSRGMLTPSNIPSATQEECKTEYISEQEFNKHGLIDVILIQQSNGNKEIIPNVEVNINHKNEILLNKLITTLKNIGFPLKMSMIFYLDPRNSSTFIYCGNDPLEKLIKYPIQQNGTKQITLKYRTPNDATFEETKPQIRRAVNTNRMSIEAPKRPKERKIKEVLEYVAKWRRLYQGYYEENGTHTQLPLEVAAQRVGISKKTLDDYLLQIRFGKKFGFNFQDNLNSKIGILRTFVKKERLNEGSGRIYQRYDSVFIDSLVDIVNEHVSDSISTTEIPVYDDKMSVTGSETTIKMKKTDDEMCWMGQNQLIGKTDDEACWMDNIPAMNKTDDEMCFMNPVREEDQEDFELTNKDIFEELIPYDIDMEYESKYGFFEYEFNEKKETPFDLAEN